MNITITYTPQEIRVFRHAVVAGLTAIEELVERDHERLTPEVQKQLANLRQACSLLPVL